MKQSMNENLRQTGSHRAVRQDAMRQGEQQQGVRRQSTWRRAAVALLVITAAGCAALGRATFAEPTVRLKDVTITGLGIQGGSVDVRLSVYNPNKFNLDALKMTYKVDIDSIPLGDGELSDRFVVQSGDSSEVRLPVRFTYAGLGAAGSSLLRSGSINYRVRGDFTVSTPLGNFTRPYNQTGRYSTVGGVGR